MNISHVLCVYIRSQHPVGWLLCVMAAGLPEDYSLLPELAATALRELGESPTTRRDSLCELRKRIAEADAAMSDAVDASERVDDAFLLRFLRCKKFDIDRSLKMYDRYRSFRRDNGLVSEVDLESQSVRNVWDLGLIGGIRSRDKKGRSILVGFPGRWNPAEQSFEDVLRAMVLQLEHIIESDETQVNGIVYIADCREFSFYQARNLRPWYFPLMASLAQVGTKLMWINENHPPYRLRLLLSHGTYLV